MVILSLGMRCFPVSALLRKTCSLLVLKSLGSSLAFGYLQHQVQSGCYHLLGVIPNATLSNLGSLDPDVGAPSSSAWKKELTEEKGWIYCGFPALEGRSELPRSAPSAFLAAATRASRPLLW